MPNSNSPFPQLGFGLGLRPEHIGEILSRPTRFDWFEALTENYLGFEDSSPGPLLQRLLRVRRDYPIVLHGVSLSIGSTDPLDRAYLKRLRSLAERVEPAWVSDHLCWTGVKGQNLHDLMPLPYTEETIRHVVGRVAKVQDFLGRRILLENVSSYLEFQASEMEEWEFVAEIARRAGCGILLDVNNIYVSSVNHSFDPLTYLDAIDPQHVVQMHLAGHTRHENYLVDTHDEPVPPAVWDLYAEAVRRYGPVSTMVERDANIPELSELEAEVDHARKIGQTAAPA